MRLISKFLLWIVSALSSVAIAACYGTFYEYDRSGRVLDAETLAGIPGIQVTCLAGGQELDVTFTYDDGRFTVYAYEACEQLCFEDVDGEQNGGEYARRCVPDSADCPEITVELHQ
ncbi:MAG: hypothetical protein JXR96_21390 [Deltaproteobacteria bacterium]|nr:hypothetical protein [Deltaproteobacteria bacterium]